MDIISILVQGYVRKTGMGALAASPSTVLVETHSQKILIDPGANPNLLLKALSFRNLSAEDVDIIFLTHYHPDHCLNLKLFSIQDVYDGSTIYHNDIEIPYSHYIPDTDIEVVPTPGHTQEHSSLLIKTMTGTYAVAGDVFWWEEGQEPETDITSLLELPDPYAQDMHTLIESRHKILELADFIIPGHGKMFKVNR
jgi:glyoxylase-like metal-dependent hydrolase (beta-lactamase superfamily II)